MLPVFSKPLEDISVDDIKNLATEQYPEDATVEFKEKIPHKKGGQDSWHTGSKVEDYGRNQILEEIVAFANAHGGHLLLGIKESDDHPHRATGISPIPRCAELADVLRLQIRDCIEPHIPIINARGVPTGDDGSGVVVIRVPESRMAPHRLKPNNECYFRHADRTEAMTMRDIQDLTIQRTRGGERQEQIFAERQAKFRGWIKERASLMHSTVGCRVTLIPTTDIYAKDVYGKPDIFPYMKDFTIELESDDRTKGFLPSYPHQERPIVRGVRRVDGDTYPRAIQELHCSGLVEICIRDTQEGLEKAKLHHSWILGTVCNGILMADSFRKYVGAPDVEYAFEVEIASTTTGISIAHPTSRFSSDLLGSPNNPCLFPRMSFGEPEEIPKLIEIVLGDIWNSCGVQFSQTVKSVTH